MPSLSRAWLLGLLWLGVGSSGCLFPVIDFDDHSAPHALSLRARPQGYAHVSPTAGAPLPAVHASITPLAPRQHASARARPTAVTPSKPSVIAPDVPAPELPTPADAASCHRMLRAEGIRFQVVDTKLTPGVRWPVRFMGPVAGVTFEPNERDNAATYGVLDCRLALTLHEWAGDLRRAGITRVAYYSMYRPFAHVGGGSRVSSHAYGMAIDAARFTLRSGTELNVLEDWEGRARGEPPCPPRAEESRGGRLLRSVTCGAADRKLFQVVLTPHYNHAHDNHVHLEIKPEVDWTYVR
jgi:hypothetical protein